MSNANRPAFPVTDAKAPPSEFEWVQGLSKREYMATEILVGLIAANYEGDAVISAIKTADRLLAELAKEPQS